MDFRLLVLVTGVGSPTVLWGKKYWEQIVKLSFKDVGFAVLKTSKYKCNVDKQDLEFGKLGTETWEMILIYTEIELINKMRKIKR